MNRANTRNRFSKREIFTSIVMIIVCFPFFAIAMENNRDTLCGFRLIEKRFIKELQTDCYYFEHIKSGARLLKIANDDPNKTFSVTFHTIPDSDCGEAHIIEHSVLNGSDRFPVKSPFDIMSKGSLKTFINALTAKDFTSYPVASMNQKDYFNLMHVYLDAVFNPLIYKDERIFLQEGWHYELTDQESPLVYKGVVYGEMKGAYSNPNRYLSYHAYRNLFPETGYGFESGGHPDAIPELTWEKFLDFHRKYYHPSNSYIVLYGDADLETELDFINRNYLSKYDRGERFLIEEQKSFESMRDVREYYPVMEGTDKKGQTFLSLNYVYSYGSDILIPKALDLLATYLFNREASPVRLALQEAGIGKDISCSSTAYKQNIMQIVVRNADPEDKQRFYDIVTSELSRLIREGINKDDFESVLNRYEFSRREDDSPNKGISYLMRNVMPSFIYLEDPFIGFEYEKELQSLRKGLTNGYYENLIKSAIVENPHCLLLTLEPSPGMDIEIQNRELQVLENTKKNFSQEEINTIIGTTKELMEYQNAEDTPEALATIPMLSLQDIDRKAICYEAEEKMAGKNQVIHRAENTNGIVYCKLFFDMKVLSIQEISYAALLAEVLGSLNTANYSFGELDREINNHTGGISTYVTRYLYQDNDSLLLPKFVISSKSTVPKVDKMLELDAEIIKNTVFNDPERLKNVLLRHHSQLESKFRSEGAGPAYLRLISYFSNTGMFYELTEGYDYYLFVSDIMQNIDSRMDELESNLRIVADKLFTKDNLVFGVTCSEEDYTILSARLEQFASGLKPGSAEKQQWVFSSDKKNEGFMAPSKVQYANLGYNFRKLGYHYHGSMLVLNRAVSRNWLNQQIRVKGGAYGGFSRISPYGLVVFTSYRDPNLTETIDIFKQTAGFVAKMDTSRSELSQLIIGTISGLDRPYSNSQRGESAYGNYFSGLDAAYYQKERDEVLGTTVDQLRRYSKMIQSVADQNVLCVYGNGEKLENAKSLFKNLVRID